MEYKFDNLPTVTFRKPKTVEKVREKTREKIHEGVNEGLNCSSTACRAIFKRTYYFKNIF
jgi:hypothetical protein